MTDNQKSSNYYRAGMTQRGDNPQMPDFVPSKIVLRRTVRSDMPYDHYHAVPCEYDSHVNKWGAVSVMVDGVYLGIKPDEFEVIKWKPNDKKVDL